MPESESFSVGDGAPFEAEFSEWTDEADEEPWRACCVLGVRKVALSPMAGLRETLRLVWGRRVVTAELLRVLRVRVLRDTARWEMRVALRTALVADTDFKLCIFNELVWCLA